MRHVALVTVLVTLALLSVGLASPADAQPNPCQSVNMHPNANALANGQVSQPYSERIWLTPANPFFTLWQATPTVPVPGLSLVPGPNANEAYLVGTPTTPGTYTFTIDAGGVFLLGTICRRSTTYTITVF